MIRPARLRPDMPSVFLTLPLCLFLCFGAGCSLRGYALRAAADAVSSAGGGYGEEEDPELARDAAAFALKTMEQLLAEGPGHRGLPLPLASGFTPYSSPFLNPAPAPLEKRTKPH